MEKEEIFEINDSKLAFDELKRHFDGINCITKERINETLKEYIELYADESKLIIEKRKLFKLIESNNSKEKKLKEINKHIKNIEEFLSKYPNYMYGNNLLKSVMHFSLIRRKIILDNDDYENDIQNIKILDNDIVNNNSIAPYIYYIANSQNVLYKDISNQIKKEGIDESETLLELLCDSYIMKVSRIATSICNIEGDREKIAEAVLEKAIINYDGKSSINYDIANIMKNNYISKTRINPKKTKEEFKNNDKQAEEVSVHEYYGQQINILELIKSNDEKYNLFLMMKYGLGIDKSFYTLESISKLLNITIEKTKEYYTNSLLFMKEYQNELNELEKVH